MDMRRRDTEGDAVIDVYEHGITRRYLMLDQHSRAYRYDGTGNVQIPGAVAVDQVFEGLEKMGRTGRSDTTRSSSPRSIASCDRPGGP